MVNGLAELLRIWLGIHYDFRKGLGFRTAVCYTQLYLCIG